MWLIAKGRLVSLLTTSMSRLTAVALRKSDPMPPSPPSLETVAANSADVHVPMGARMIGTLIPNTSQSGVLSIVSAPGCAVSCPATEIAHVTLTDVSNGGHPETKSRRLLIESASSQ